MKKDGTCKICPKGESWNSSNLECSCIEGYNMKEDGACEMCQKGEWWDGSSLRCMPCQKGKFKSVPGEQECDKCPNGKYASKEEATECSSCPPYSSTNSTGAWNNTECICQQGYFKAAGTRARPLACHHRLLCSPESTSPKPRRRRVREVPR